MPYGRVLDLGAYEAMIQIPNCIGAKHSSLSRRLEWERIAVRNRVRPEFHVFTGNDLAIDMVRYGSDWLLGQLPSDEPHPDSPRRPASDREIIATILRRIDAARAA